MTPVYQASVRNMIVDELTNKGSIISDDDDLYTTLQKMFPKTKRTTLMAEISNLNRNGFIRKLYSEWDGRKVAGISIVRNGNVVKDKPVVTTKDISMVLVQSLSDLCREYANYHQDDNIVVRDHIANLISRIVVLQSVMRDL